MAVPTFKRVAASAAWSGAGPPGLLSAATSGTLLTDDLLIVVAVAEDLDASLTFDAVGHAPLAFAGRARVWGSTNAGFQFGASATIQTDRVWSWAALVFGSGAKYYSLQTLLTGHIAAGDANVTKNSETVYPEWEENLIVGLAAYAGQGVRGKLTVPGTALAEVVGEDGSGGEYVCKPFYSSTSACGNSQLALTVHAPSTGAGDYSLSAHYLLSTGVAACAVPDDGADHIPPTTGYQYRAWFDMDFDWHSDGIVAVVVPNAGNINYGQLQVWRYDDAEPPNTLESVTLETQDVHGASICVTPDGVVHVFYDYDGDAAGVIAYRQSVDGGRTFGSRQAIPSGLATVFGDDTGQTSQGGGSIPQSHGGHCYPCAYSRKHRALFMLMSSGGSRYLAYLRRLTTAQGWEVTARHSTADYGRALQALSDGSVFNGLLYEGLNEAMSGVSSASIISGITVGTNGGVWIDPHAKVLLAINPDDHSKASGSGSGDLILTYNAYRWRPCFQNAAGTWEASPEWSNFYADRISRWGWDYIAEVNDNQDPTGGATRYASTAFALKCRRDGVWFLLRPAESGELQWARARYVPESGAIVWAGRDG